MGKKYRGGFTLIELSLSLVFIAILSLMIVFLIQNVSSSYRRGLILNQVNTVGMDLIDDFRISVQNATSDPITRMCDTIYPIYMDNTNNEFNVKNNELCVKDNANGFVSVFKTADVTISDDEKLKDVLVYGAFCTGTYTYIWNSGYFESVENPDFNDPKKDKYVVEGEIKPAVLGYMEGGSYVQKYPLSHDDGGEDGDFFRLLKVYDDNRSVCVNAMKNQDPDYQPQEGKFKYISPTLEGESDHVYSNTNVKNEFVIRESSISGENEDVAELMKRDKASDLVLYEFYVAKPALSTTRKNLFYAASFILGTRRGGINIMRAGNSCRPPNDDYTEFEYCAINKFNFAVMAGGK